MLVLFLHMGNASQAQSDESVIAAKINFGTFSALAGGEKVSPTMAEMLRGLLCDKVSDRWTLRNLEMWMLGQYFNPILPNLPQRATRPIRLGGGEQLNRPAAANAMAMHWDEALTNLDNRHGGKLAEARLQRREGRRDPAPDARTLDELWRIDRRQASDGVAPHPVHGTEPADLLQEHPCQRAGHGHHAGRGDRSAPLRTEFVEMLRGRLPQGWLDRQPKLTPELAAMRRMLDAAEKVLERPGPGYSVERVLYELDAGMPCRSELIGDYYVTSLKDVLPAIDAAFTGAAAGTMPIDRHICAFVASKLAKPIERELTLIANTADQSGYRMGILRLLAAVQRQHPNHDLPRLAETLLELTKPVVESFHRVQSRSEIRNKLERFAAHSDLVQMAELLDEGRTVAPGPMRRASRRRRTPMRSWKRKRIGWTPEA